MIGWSKNMFGKKKAVIGLRVRHNFFQRFSCRALFDQLKVHFYHLGLAYFEDNFLKSKYFCLSLS